MLKSIRDFFESHIAATSTPSDERHSIQLATAALLVEVARIDSQSTEDERSVVLRAVREKFELGADEAAALIEAWREVRAGG